MTDNDAHDGPPESVFGEVGDHIVFLRGGTVATHVYGDAGLHKYTRREDYGFALSTAGVDILVGNICEEHGLSPSLYGNLVEEAVVRGAIIAGFAALFTLDTQAWSDRESAKSSARD